MPLTDFVRNLNDLNARPAHWAQGISQFISTDGRVFVRFANLFLESTFKPIVDTATGKLHGHAASLRAYSFSTRLPVRPEAVFVLPSDDEEFVYLDRLVRTLHALNYPTNLFWKYLPQSSSRSNTLTGCLDASAIYPT